MKKTSAREDLRDARDHIKEAARESLLAMRTLLDAALKALDRDGGASESGGTPNGDPAETMTPPAGGAPAGGPPNINTPPHDPSDRI